MPGYTLEQMTRVPYVMGVIQEYNSVGSTISRFYKLGLRDSAGQTLASRTGIYDIYNPTRSMPLARAPMTGPSRTGRKPIGHKMITVPRFYEALEIEYERVYQNRPIGGQFGTVDAAGASYIARQLKFQSDRFANLHEFMAVNLFRGGWSLKPSGEDLYPVELGTAGATINVESLVPEDHKGQIPLLGVEGNDIISVPWNDPDCPIIEQFMLLDTITAIRHGSKIKHIWGNGVTLNHLFNNVQLHKVGGVAVRIFDSMTGREIDPGQRNPDTGVDIIFRGLPDRIFHIYNQVYVSGEVSESQVAQTNPANIKKFIPDNEVIMTPEPDTWCEKVHGTEPVQFNLKESVRSISGLGMGREEAIDPPRIDMKMLYNGCPILVEQFAVYNPTVIFEPEPEQA
jgi:hypothetical protein